MASLRTIPIPDLQSPAFGTVSVLNETARRKVRIFRRGDASEWIFTPNEYKFTADQLRAGLDLGIDARDTRRPGVWDGRVSVYFNVTDESKTSTDTVNLRVAPILTHHHRQSSQEIFTTAGNKTVNIFQEKFVSSLRTLLRNLNIHSSLFEFNQSDDLWAQDFFEPAYTSMPGPGGPVVLQVMVRSAQDGRVAGRQVFEYLRKTGRGAVQHLHGAQSETDAMGNLETIPPYKFNGTVYPAGRIVQGAHGSRIPFMLEYMQAQELQDPILLDTEWLAVGHVDEFIQFLPANTTRGWVMVVADTNAGVEILEKARESGHGHILAFSRPNDPEGGPSKVFGYSDNLDSVPNCTINDILSKTDLAAANKRFSRKINANINILKEATGILDEDIHYVPSIFRTVLTFPPGQHPLFSKSDNLNNKARDPYSAGALYPSAINGVVLSDSDYLVPNPWGPIIDGKDILAEAVKNVYQKLGYQITFLDDWSSHHFWGGEIHCGTNTIRDGSQPWW